MKTRKSDSNYSFTGIRRTQARITGCSTLPSDLNINALVYLNDANGNAYCPVSKSTSVHVKVVSSSVKVVSSKKAHACPTPSPTPPGQPFEVYGLGQRCLEAGQLAPWNRRAQEEAKKGQMDLEAAQQAALHEKNEARKLAITTPQDCWHYCNINAYSVPSYFNWNTLTNQVRIFKKRRKYKTLRIPHTRILNHHTALDLRTHTSASAAVGHAR